MKDIFVVVKEVGEYSNYSMEVVCWFDTEGEANAEVKRLRKEVKGSNCLDCPTYSAINLPHGTTLAGKKLE